MLATGGHGSITQPRSVEALETKMSAAQTAFDTFISCKSALGNTVRTEEIPNCMHWKTNQLMTSFFFTDSIWNYFFYYFFHWTSRTCCNAKCFSYNSMHLRNTKDLKRYMREAMSKILFLHKTCLHACMQAEIFIDLNFHEVRIIKYIWWFPEWNIHVHVHLVYHLHHPFELKRRS